MSKSYHTSSMRRTFARFKMARAIQSSCFSLKRRTTSAQVISSMSGEDTHPAEKFSPPSETGESRLRKTLALIALVLASESSSEGMRWTRRRASYYARVMSVAEQDFAIETRTISTSSYSLKTSKVDLRVPLKMVGSSSERER